MAFTKITSDGIGDNAIDGKLGYVPSGKGYSNSTIFEFTLAAMHNGVLGTGESYATSSNDPFGVPLQDVKLYDMMEPKSEIRTLDLASGENYVGE
jgi:hypothetical protein